MGRIKEQMSLALDFMPRHRFEMRRRRTLNLDMLLEDARAIEKIDAGTLDLVLMGYRSYWLFQIHLKTFLKKPLDPVGVEDLLLLGFAALLTRTQIPAPVLVSECVEAAEKVYGPHMKGFCNAFLRQVLRDQQKIVDQIEKDPLILLGPEIPKHLSPQDALKIARLLLKRPPSGIHAFHMNGTFEFMSTADFFQKKNEVQAMDPGSFALCEWMAAQIETFWPNKTELRILDACAAPGGKLIVLDTLLVKKNIKVKWTAVDTKQARIDVLKSNIKRLKIEDHVEVLLDDWAKPLDAQSFDVVLMDLPCTGTGTFHTRPDLLLEDIDGRALELKAVQRQIVESVLATHSTGRSIAFVSLCSVMKTEIQHISYLLKKNTIDFHSWDNGADTSEGLCAWSLKKEIS